MPAVALNTWTGVVTHITDGDTLWVQPTDAPVHAAPRKIRLDGIDAPESCQLYGEQATAALKKLLAAKTVVVSNKRFDDYGRDVARITLDNKDVGSWMVRNGHAWSYHYRHSSGPYQAEEMAAMRERLGLFANTSAIQPSLFRREHGSCHLPNDALEKRHKRYK